MVQTGARALKRAAEAAAKPASKKKASAASEPIEKKKRSGKQSRERAKEAAKVSAAYLAAKAAAKGSVAAPSAPAPTAAAPAAAPVNAEDLVDQELVCKDCETAFSFTASEQAFYLEQGFALKRVRCSWCAKAKKAKYGEGADAPTRCYNCGKNGHVSRDCPEARSMRCYICGAEGHMSRACPQAPADGGGASCFHCGQVGHMSSECTAALRVAVRGGVDRDGGGGGEGVWRVESDFAPQEEVQGVGGLAAEEERRAARQLPVLAQLL